MLSQSTICYLILTRTRINSAADGPSEVYNALFYETAAMRRNMTQEQVDEAWTAGSLFIDLTTFAFACRYGRF